MPQHSLIACKEQLTRAARVFVLHGLTLRRWNFMGRSEG